MLVAGSCFSERNTTPCRHVLGHSILFASVFGFVHVVVLKQAGGRRQRRGRRVDYSDSFIGGALYETCEGARVRGVALYKKGAIMAVLGLDRLSRILPSTPSCGSAAAA